jgi:hypothetical protein
VLAVAVGMIQTNARDVGELQKKLDQWHSMGMDEREIDPNSYCQRSMEYITNLLKKPTNIHDLNIGVLITVKFRFMVFNVTFNNISVIS